jgi:hypothetical protein
LKFTKAWAIDMAERVAGTFVAGFLAALVVGTGAGVSLAALQAAALAGLASAVTLLKSLVGAYIGNPNSASLIPSVGYPPPAPAPAPVAAPVVVGADKPWPFEHPFGGPPINPHPFAPPPAAAVQRVPAERITPLHPNE